MRDGSENGGEEAVIYTSVDLGYTHGGSDLWQVSLSAWGIEFLIYKVGEIVYFTFWRKNKLSDKTVFPSSFLIQKNTKHISFTYIKPAFNIIIHCPRSYQPLYWGFIFFLD